MMKLLVFLLSNFHFIVICSQSIVGDYTYKVPLLKAGYFFHIRESGMYEYTYSTDDLTIVGKGTWELECDTLILTNDTATIYYDCTGKSDSVYTSIKRNYINCINPTKKFLILKSRKSLKKNGCITKRKYYPRQWNKYVFDDTFSKPGAKKDCTPRRFVPKNERIYLKALFDHNCSGLLF